MESLLVEEPRRPLSTLQANTSLSYDVTAGKHDQTALKAKGNRSAAAHVSASTTKPLPVDENREKNGASHTPPLTSTASRAHSGKEATAAPLYPALRSVLHDANCPNSERASPFSEEEQPAQTTVYEKKIEVSELGRQRSGEVDAEVRQKDSPGDISHAISVHPPTSAKPHVPSRRASMARLRQHQPQPAEQARAEAAAATPAPTMKSEGDSTHHTAKQSAGLQIFSYRPMLVSPTPVSSLRSSISDDAIKTHAEHHSSTNQDIYGGPADRATKEDKVLPVGLRSPSGGTEMGDGVADGNESTKQNSVDTTIASGSAAASPPRRSPLPRLSLHAAANERGHATETAAERSAPFKALQFVSQSSHDAFTSPPLSGRSDYGDSESKTAMSEKQKKGRFSSTSGGHGHGEDAVDYRNALRDSDREDLLICPFAMLGCCPRGTHTASELEQNTMLHHHLVAVASCLHRMKAHQQRLEQSVVILQNHVNTQAGALKRTTDEIAQLRRAQAKNERDPPGKESSSLPQQWSSWTKVKEAFRASPRALIDSGAPATAEVSLSRETLRDNEEEDGSESVGDTQKALPRDVSLLEPQVTDFGAEDDDTDSTDEVARQELSNVDEGTYARQLRRRTESAKLLYALRESQQAEARGTRGKEVEKKSAVAPSSSAAATADAASSAGFSQGRASSAQPRLDDKHAERRRRSDEQQSMNHAHWSIGTGPRTTRTQRDAFVGQPYQREVQRGACGSTEVSGMSNVPPYQLPNESVSTISSGSCDLDDHEDDIDVGEMRQQLHYLSAEEKEEALVAVVTRELSAKVGKKASAPHTSLPSPSHALHSRANEELSARSTPSLVSTTYRPSQFAQACAAPVATLCGARADLAEVGAAARSSPTRRPARDVQHATTSQQEPLTSDQHNAITDSMQVTGAGDGVRLALPLHRPTLIRQTDVVHDKSQNKTPLVLPRTSMMTATANTHQRRRTAPTGIVEGIMHNTVELKPRRLSSLDSEGRRVAAVDIHEPEPMGEGCEDDNNATKSAAVACHTTTTIHAADKSGGGRHGGARGGSTGSGTQLASPAPQPPAGHRRNRSPLPNAQQPTSYAHSYHYVEDSSDDCRESMSALVGPLKNTSGRRRVDEAKLSSRQRSRSRSGREAAVRRPQHATSLLSTKEAGEVHEVVHLGLPPRRVEPI